LAAFETRALVSTPDREALDRREDLPDLHAGFEIIAKLLLGCSDSEMISMATSGAIAMA